MPNNITVKDALSVNQVVKTVETAGVHVPVHQTDNGATEVTAAALLARTPVLLTTTAHSDTAAQPVRPAPQDIWSAGFSSVGSSVLDSRFNTPRVGTGVTYNQGSGSLNILSGTTANAEFLAKSIQSFSGSMRMRFSATLSQRIANNNFAILLADSISDNAAYNIINATTVDVTVTAHGFDAAMVGQFALLGGITGAAGIPGRYAIASIPDVNTIRFTVAGWPASGTGTLCLFGRNYVRNLFNGTTATSVAVDAQRNGWAAGDTTATINTTASPGVVIANELTGRDAFFSDSLRATSTAPTFTTRASRYENIPDQSSELYVFVWSFNGTVAPASTTTLTLGHIAVESFPNNPVYIQGFRAQGATNPIPVTVASGTVTTVSTVSTVTAVTASGTPTAPATPFILNSAATTNATLVLTGTSGLHAFYATNTGAAAAYVKLYNKATAPTVGTDVPAMILVVPAAAGGVPGVCTLPIGHNGFRFALGLGLAITGGAADADTTAVAAGQVKVMLSRTV
jgi:hypothetical protein